MRRPIKIEAAFSLPDWMTGDDTTILRKRIERLASMIPGVKYFSVDFIEIDLTNDADAV